MASSEVPTDQDVFVELYPTLRRFAAVVADLDVDPDDLLHDAVVATLRQKQLNEIRQPAAYMKRAILNAATNHRRRQGRFRRYAPRLGRASSTTDNYPSDLAALELLAPLDRAVVYLAEVERIPHAVIAEELDLTPNAVRKRASRSRKQLRRALRPELSAVTDEHEKQEEER